MIATALVANPVASLVANPVASLVASLAVATVVMTATAQVATKVVNPVVVSHDLYPLRSVMSNIDDLN